MTERSTKPRSFPAIRVVAHHPWRQAFALATVALVTLAGSVGGYWLGKATAGLDRIYFEALERLDVANRQAIARLEAALVDNNLALQVDREAAQTLKGTIRELKDSVADLTEEVTFYKSLMAPSSLDRGLQIADFEVSSLEEAGRFRFHLLLTQVESRRDWIQGDIGLEVHGRGSTGGQGESTTGGESGTATLERVLPLTEIAEEATYPLKFRFRYFQDLTGTIRLPAGFEPERVVVTADPRGAGSEARRRTFDWSVAG